MPAQYDIAITAGIDDKGVEQGTKAMEKETKAFSAAAEKEFRRVETAASRTEKAYNEVAKAGARAAREVASSAGRGAAGAIDPRFAAGRGRGSYIAGAVAMQAQDVAVQLQSGARAATVIAQQGSQIASFFGPTGAIVGGVIAIGAATVEWLTNTQKEERELAKVEARLEKMKSFNAASERQISDDQAALQIAKLRVIAGDKAADAAQRRYEFDRKIVDIAKAAGEADMANANAAVSAAQARFDYEEQIIKKRERAAERIATIEKEGSGIMARVKEIMTPANQRASQRRQERAENRAIRRAVEEQEGREDARQRNYGGIDPVARDLSRNAHRKRREELATSALMVRSGQLSANMTDAQMKVLAETIATAVEKLISR